MQQPTKSSSTRFAKSNTIQVLACAYVFGSVSGGYYEGVANRDEFAAALRHNGSRIRNGEEYSHFIDQISYAAAARAITWSQFDDLVQLAQSLVQDASGNDNNNNVEQS